MLPPDCVAVFQVPKILVGPTACVLSFCCCQSPDLSLWLFVMSVATSEGKIGRPTGSAAVGSPVATGLVPPSTMVPGNGVTPGSTPNVSACSSVANTPTRWLEPVPKTWAATSTVLSLKTADERGLWLASGDPRTHGPRLDQFFVAVGGSPGSPSPVSRCSDTPPTVTFVAALTTVVPTVDDVIVAEHEPDPPAVVQLVGVTKLPGPETIENVIVVPSGAFT